MLFDLGVDLLRLVHAGENCIISMPATRARIISLCSVMFGWLVIEDTEVAAWLRVCRTS